MSDETTDESNAEGEEANKHTTDDEENISKLDKLKAANAELEKEITKEKELKAEAQKLEAERMLSGKSSAGQVKKPKEETDEEYTERFERGEIDLAK